MDGYSIVFDNNLADGVVFYRSRIEGCLALDNADRNALKKKKRQELVVRSHDCSLQST